MINDAKEFHKKATDLIIELKNGNYEDRSMLIDEIILNFELSLDSDPENFKTWMELGAFYFQLKYYNESLNCCEKVISLNPKSLSGYKNKALNLRFLKRYREALNCYSDALIIFPKEASLYFEKSIIQRSMGNFDKALRQCNNALKLDSKNPAYNFQKGIIFGDLEEFRMGAECFRTALKFTPDDEHYNRFRKECHKLIKIFENKFKSHTKKTKTRIEYGNGLGYKEGMPSGKKMARGSFAPIYFPSQKDNIYQVDDLDYLKEK